jgi:hypothetical protein
MKLRPVLLLAGPIGTIPEVLAAYISSIAPSMLLASDIVLDPKQPEHVGTKLKTTSVLRLHKLATIHERSVVRYLGKISPTTIAEVAAKLRTLLQL